MIITNAQAWTAVQKAISRVQQVLLIPQTGVWDTATETRYGSLVKALADDPSATWTVLPDPITERELKGDGTWPWSAWVVGEDIVMRDTAITCFGGWGGGNIADPDDNGRTASGRNTKNEEICGCSIPMDGRLFPAMSHLEHLALDGAPFPRIPFGTPVEVTIDGKTILLPDGIVDLGPGHRVQSKTKPKALDLTTWAAKRFSPVIPISKIAQTFEARGSFRIIGGARFV